MLSFFLHTFQCYPSSDWYPPTFVQLIWFIRSSADVPSSSSCFLLCTGTRQNGARETRPSSHSSHWEHLMVKDGLLLPTSICTVQKAMVMLFSNLNLSLWLQGMRNRQLLTQPLRGRARPTSTWIPSDFLWHGRSTICLPLSIKWHQTENHDRLMN
jgi:hypothetical protein